MQTTDDILFSAHGPDPIPTATTEVVGTPGNALNVYWIVSHFPIGSVVSGPFPQKSSPNVLDDENYVHISWLPTLGALSYDLLFTRRLELPKQPGNFALAFNLTDTEFRDTGLSLSEYDLAGIRYGAPQQEWIFFDNRDRKQPTLRFIPWPIEVSSIFFQDGSEISSAGAAGFPGGPNRSIQFNNNGAFDGSPNLIWDNVDLRIGLGTQNPVQPLHIVNPNGLGYIRLESFSPDLRTLYSGLEFYTSGNYVAEIGAWVHNDPINDGLSIDLGDSINNIFINHATGYVGINTGNPQYRLDVLGQAADPIPSTIDDAVFAVRTTTGVSLRCGGRVTWPYDPWVQGQGTSGSIIVNPLGGSVVIGDRDYTGLQSRLTVNVLANGPQNVANFYSLDEPRIWLSTWAGIGAPQGQMTFMTSGGNFGNWVERMRITGQGNVGIGTQNPQASLDVNGFIRSLGFLPIPTSGRAVEINYIEGEGGYVSAVDRSTNTNLTLILQGSGAGIALTDGIVDMSADDTIQMVTGGLPRMQINSQGRVDITGSLYINGVQVLP